MSLEIDPEEVDVHRLALWAGTNVTKISKLMKRISTVSQWQPPGETAPPEARHHQRWLVETISLAILPVRWTPREDSTQVHLQHGCSGKADRGAEGGRLAHDRPPRAGALRIRGVLYGGDAPDEIDEHIVVEALEVWREECLADASALDDLDDDDGWEDDLDEA